eukprot:scaffold126132_cov69-Phaeocystis_antarctica.AAC.2
MGGMSELQAATQWAEPARLNGNTVECQLNANSIAARGAGALRRGAVMAKGVLFAKYGGRGASCLKHSVHLEAVTVDRSSPNAKLTNTSRYVVPLDAPSDSGVARVM